MGGAYFNPKTKTVEFSPVFRQFSYILEFFRREVYKTPFRTKIAQNWTKIGIFQIRVV